MALKNMKYIVTRLSTDIQELYLHNYNTSVRDTEGNPDESRESIFTNQKTPHS